MKTTHGRILKANTVTVEGTRPLEVNLPVQPPVPSAAPAVVADRPRVRIVEKTAAFAVVEVVCGCGAAIQVRCDYENS